MRHPSEQFISNQVNTSFLLCQFPYCIRFRMPHMLHLLPQIPSLKGFSLLARTQAPAAQTISLLCLRGVHHPCVIQAFAKHRGSTRGADCETSYSMTVRLVRLPLRWFVCCHACPHPLCFFTWASHACPCPYYAGSLHKPMPTQIHLWSLLGLHMPMLILTGCPSYATAGRPPCAGS